MRETAYDATSFAAGEACGTRVAASIARLAALELTDHARWWNRWRRRLMASALLACAEELESAADEDGRRAPAWREGEPVHPAPIRAAERVPVPAGP